MVAAVRFKSVVREGEAAVFLVLLSSLAATLPLPAPHSLLVHVVLLMNLTGKLMSVDGVGGEVGECSSATLEERSVAAVLSCEVQRSHL